ncbi:SDR family oxidoreductase [Rhodovastum atsumiense]|uniref:SDR family oxidoreductase n=1 Tax=Rhodovastum atsumiense TaxID=504468 RepID=A0A5M6IM51_9PROT|nr:SDR family oxidoreductase [Rhodovastum atsumiense]KAA5609373.1 SDR family oxidoreductase [Rhodovastum atsumiense]CAH2598587.1 SDR family oxidoreductase [Rhodovastum atsumiense]
MLSIEDFRLEGRVALVSGAGHGIGRAVAEAFGAAGARVGVVEPADAAAAEAVAGGIRASGGEALALPADPADAAAAAGLIDSVVRQLGGLDVLVTSSGAAAPLALRDITAEEWEDGLRRHLSAAFFLARHALAYMSVRKWGRVILMPGAPAGPMLAAQAGLQGLARAIASEFGADGITANIVAAGAIDTAGGEWWREHRIRNRITAQVPLGRLGSADEVAAACLFLSSPAGGFVSGQVLHVDGGQGTG